MEKVSESGQVVWQDLTVPNADEIRDFYSAVVGWKHDPVDMGGYHDHNMMSANGTVTAGICHTRGSNAKLPPQWILYVTVASLETSIRECRSRGGDIIDGPRAMGKQQFCLIRDPAGAYLGLIENEQKGQ